MHGICVPSLPSFKFLFLLAFVGLAAHRSYTIYTSIQSADPEGTSEPDAVYAHKYVEEFRGMEDSPTQDRIGGLMKATVSETTPEGEVEIALNSGDPGSFKYWTTAKNIPFSHLETVARLFCIRHSCKTMCIDTPSEIKKEYHRIKAKEQAKLQDVQSKGGVFVDFKSYNRKVARAGSSKVAPRRSNQFKKMEMRVTEICAEAHPAEKCSYKDWTTTADLPK